MRICHASLSLRILRMNLQMFVGEKLSVLRSYGTRNREDHGFLITHREDCSTLFGDSGTFTKFNRSTESPIPITLPGYIRHLNRYGHRYDFYMNFDECFIDEMDGYCFEQNIANQIKMEKAGLHPVPVIHDIHGEEVQYYIEEGYEMVAVGSPQITDFETLYSLVNRFKGRDIKIHLFATSKYDYLTELPIFSCDTTSWVKTGGYGSIFYWNPHKRKGDKRDKIYLEDYLLPGIRKEKDFTSYPHRKEVEEHLDRTFGITYEDLMGPRGFELRMLVNTHFFHELEKRINEVQRRRGFFTAE